MKVDIHFFREKILAENYRFTKHATIQRIKRKIYTDEIIEAILSGEIIEKYPEDKYSPSILIMGFTKNNRPLHILCSYSETVWIITAYQPNQKQWIDFKVRRKSNE